MAKMPNETIGILPFFSLVSVHCAPSESRGQLCSNKSHVIEQNTFLVGLNIWCRDCWKVQNVASVYSVN